jgi:hypothetical protein
MIIFGMSPRTKTTDSGTFFCPHCRTSRSYERKEGRNYFSLYFIPLIPLGKPQTFIECTTCHLTFAPEVLSAKAPPPKADLVTHLNSLKTSLESGTPVEYALRNLTAAGVDWDVALGLVKSAIGEGRKTCPTDGLSYAPNITTCRECGQVLS